MSVCEIFAADNGSQINHCRYTADSDQIVDPQATVQKNVSKEENDEAILSAVNAKSTKRLKALFLAGYSADIMVSTPLETSGEISLIMSITNTQYLSKDDNQDIIIAMIKGGVDISVTDEDGNTLLHRAISKQKMKVAKALLSCGANPQVVNKYGETPIFNASTPALIEFSIKHKLGTLSDVDNWGNTLLHESVAVSSTTKEHVAFLAKHIDINTVNSNHRTPIQRVISQGSLFSEDNARMLIALGADVEILDKKERNVLINAVQSRRVAIDFIIEMIDNSTNINHRDRYNKAAIHYARGRVELIKAFKKSGVKIASVVYPNDERSTLLTKAVSDNNLTLVTYLLDENVDINAHDFTGKTALNLALENKFDDVVALLTARNAQASSDEFIATMMVKYEKEKARPKNILQAIAKKNIELVKKYYQQADLEKTFSLEKSGIKAVDSGHVEGLEYLMSKGFSLNTLDQGYSLLHNAVFFNQPEMVDYLLSKGASLTSMSEDDTSIIFMTANTDLTMLNKIEKLGLTLDPKRDENIVGEAIRVNNYVMAREFVKRGFHLEQGKYFDPNFLERKVVRKQNAELLIFLVEQGFDINTRFTKILRHGNLLYLSIMLRANEMIEPILKLGIDVKEPIGGEPILAIAIHKGEFDHVKLLLKYHPDLELNSMGEDTFQSHRNVLLQALNSREEEIALYFIDFDLDFNQHTTFKQNALHLAAERGYTTVVKRLIDKGVDINWQDTWGNTPLIMAASSTSTDIIKLLVDAGANVTTVNNNKQSADSILRAQGNEDMVKLLTKGP